MATPLNWTVLGLTWVGRLGRSGQWLDVTVRTAIAEGRAKWRSAWSAWDHGQYEMGGMALAVVNSLVGDLHLCVQAGRVARIEISVETWEVAA